MDNKYKKLRDQWYKKIAKTGFKDIEDIGSPREMLKRWDSTWFRNRPGSRSSTKKYTEQSKLPSIDGENPSVQKFNAIQEYYYKAEHFLNAFEFKSKKEKKYWDMHVKGLSAHEISRRCKASRKVVGSIINDLKKVMLAWKS